MGLSPPPELIDETSTARCPSATQVGPGVAGEHHLLLGYAAQLHERPGWVLITDRRQNEGNPADLPDLPTSG
ncbi:hypothetical protein Krad_2421 [Kineococcus radiotolerans SRS30216 = ATCC BAA-149]|uniref:Uncharacterized protein n=1 Tax=Kineococcus radiotolerans (strain ATCC BAA-149 / DSM 14245 / SRS30216) TaxID=266940 RepID=A6WAR2_KINRD|nr:hypothetical protein Krad_2421 [Kineococcus radiotolerans SRS30216 = ATCC BAA-149]